jgi:diguanylate cyclase (GGDEF)-like protein
MESNNDTIEYLNSNEIERFEKVIADIHNADNILLEEFTQLSECYKKLIQHSSKLRAENKQLKTKLVNIVRSLDLTSGIDGMTGLSNRHDIMGKIDREATRSQRHHHSFTILLVNVDDFNKINDAYGYNTGDDVLVEIARVLRGCVRNEDICARWGGEEFLILLPETNCDSSLPVAKKVLESISMTEFKAHKPGIHITVSIGISEYIAPQTVQGCIVKVNQALLQAKKDGKNRYIVAK